MKTFIFYFFLFFLYAVLGWIIETIYVTILDKKFVNRGFLIGPYIPLYGVSAITMILYLNQYKTNPLTVFLLAIFVCTFLEYITSYIMEKIFKARWWDYTNQKFNINGRVCLKNSLYFGILSLLLIYLINPLLINLINNMNNIWLTIITIVCLTIFITDIFISCNVILKLKHNFENLRFDATMELRKLIDIKIKRKILQNRIYNAFPKLKFYKKK